jgi:hypothetical protein
MTNPLIILKVVGVLLATVFFWHLYGVPWCLVAGAAVAMLFLP